MARATLTPTTLQADNVATAVSANSATTVTSGAGNGVLFANVPGATFMIVNVGGTPTNLTVTVGSTVLGQAVTSFTVVCAASASYIVGPFHSVLDQPGSNQIAVDFSSSTSVTVGVFQTAGVY